MCTRMASLATQNLHTVPPLWSSRTREACAGAARDRSGARAGSVARRGRGRGGAAPHWVRGRGAAQRRPPPARARPAPRLARSVTRESAPASHVSRPLNTTALRCRCETGAASTMPAEEEPAAMESRDADGSPQQFCLRWNNYQSNLANCFDQLLQTESFVDVTLACEGQSLKAHKVVLSACSPYFQTLFMDNPCRHPIIIMRDIKYCDLKAVVDFMYRGEINVSQDQITALLKVAETLKIRGLTDVSGEQAVLRPGGVGSGGNGGGGCGVEARASKRAVSREAESPAKSRRRASAERSPGPSPRAPASPAPDAPADLAAPPPPLHADDVDIRPGIAEMIREEERVSTPSVRLASPRCAPETFPAIPLGAPRAPFPRRAKLSFPYRIT
ncbi:unnamed protein product [Chilo suppressalis]|uniref:BTB domain-containing protein n=1 Tax=Chilo suppressalis TaxID=168631 RepID=A0ABN8B081_CHISP|nr:unnamed protein product [Chilo suppressalis]